MPDDAYETIAADLLQQIEQSGAVDVAALRTRHPGHESAVDRVLRAWEGYQGLQGSSEPRRPPVLEALPCGERLGDFEVQSPLAAGGMGVVYRARQLSLGSRPVALKVLPADCAHPRGRDRFQREALALAGLHHPHLSEVFGFGEERGLLFYAMRLVEGPTLSRVIDALAAQRIRPLDGKEIRAMVRRIAEIASALAAVHEAGLVHRDVKPSNILLEGAGSAGPEAFRAPAILVDFGLARPVGQHALTLTGQSAATPSFAPPEQLLGHEVDARADVFSLGVTLHDLLARRPVGERAQASVGLEPIASLVPGIDPDLAAIVRKAVDPQARWRYPHARALHADLQGWLEGRQVSARRAPPLERARRWAARNPDRGVRIAALSALAAGIVWGAVSYGRRSSLVNSAFRRGDVPALVSAVRAVPSWSLRLAGASEAVVEFASRERAGTLPQAVAAIERHLAAREPERALLAAATHLAVEGPLSQPVVTNFFLQALGAEEVRTSPSRSELRPLAVVLSGRLFYEGPIVRSGDAREQRAIIAALRGLFAERHALDRTSRLYLVTSLSGCGAPGDIDAILEFAAGAGTGSEEQRIGLQAAERIVRRAHGLGTLREVDFGALWSAYGPLVERFDHQEGRGFAEPLVRALRRLHRSALAAERAARGDLAPAAFTCGRWLESADPSLPHVRSNWWRALAIARHPELERALLEPRRLQEPLSDPRNLGIACGCLGSEQAAAAGREHCRALGSWELAAFEEGFREGSDELRGLVPEMAPDPDTRLGWRDEGAGARPLGAQRVAQPPADLASGAGDLAAFWTFALDATFGGSARDGEVQACGLDSDVPLPNPARAGFLRFFSFGRSQLALDFQSSDLPPELSLVLWHQMGARDYYPFQGQVYLEVLFNGEVLARDLLMQTTGMGTLSLPLPQSQIVSGANRVMVRLSEATTTTYRLYAAAIRRGP